MRDRPAQQDAELLALAAEFRRGAKRHALALKALGDAEERFTPPSPPAALLRRPDDKALPFHPSARVGEVYGKEDVQLLREFLHMHKRGKRQLAPIPPAMRARMLEIIAACEDFTRADFVARREAGEFRAGARFDRACYAKQELYSKIGRTPAATAAGLLAKLVIASWDVATHVEDFADESQVEFVLASAVADARARARLATIREGLGLAAP